eukprot:g7826.t1
MANIRVSARIRPQSDAEIGNGGTVCVHCDGGGRMVSVGGAVSRTDFVLDHVFDVGATQAEVYEAAARPLVLDVLEGYNCTIFAYGQTGSGKTHTLVGDIGNAAPAAGAGQEESGSPDRGVVPRSIDDIFACSRRLEKDSAAAPVASAAAAAAAAAATTSLPSGRIEFSIKVSYLEIYNEKIRDLLNPPKRGAMGYEEPLRVRETPERGTFVEGATEWVVGSAAEAKALLRQGSAARAVGAHAMNARSSRSHTLFVQTIERRLTRGGGKDGGGEGEGGGERKTGRLYLVDLAGSEMVRKTQASGQALLEARHINKSLSALALVISNLAGESAGMESGGIPKARPRTRQRRRSSASLRPGADGDAAADPGASAKGHVPYRDSKLTRILQDSLGGNAKTALVVTCSASSLQMSESLSTLRFGSCASRVKNRPRVNRVRNVNYYQERLQNAEKSLQRLSAHIARLERGSVSAGAGGAGGARACAHAAALEA